MKTKREEILVCGQVLFISRLLRCVISLSLEVAQCGMSISSRVKCWMWSEGGVIHLIPEEQSPAAPGAGSLGCRMRLSIVVRHGDSLGLAPLR